MAKKAQELKDKLIRKGKGDKIKQLKGQKQITDFFKKGKGDANKPKQSSRKTGIEDCDDLKEKIVSGSKTYLEKNPQARKKLPKDGTQAMRKGKVIYRS